MENQDLDKNLNNLDFDISFLFKLLFRRKKIFLASIVFCGLTSSIFATYVRIFKPTYQGSFTLLISDPINSSKDQNSKLRDNSLVERIAINSTSNDIPTLITLLKSPLLLNKVAEKYDLKPVNLANSIYIDQKPLFLDTNSASLKAKGILNIKLFSNDLKQGKSILNTLSEVYLQSALEQRQKKINNGIDFLNKQAPMIQKKADNLQNELAKFRIDNLLLEPGNEGLSLRNLQLEVDQEIFKLEYERERLINVKEEIGKGNLTARGFQEAITSDDKGQNIKGLTIGDYDQSVLKELILIENELAKAKATFTKDSIIVRGLEKRQKKIKPTFLKSQIEAVDTALKLNQAKLNITKKKRSDLKNKFELQPKLIKDYNNLKGKLEISNSNLTSLMKARERFQLEIAQSSVPWSIIAPPKMLTKPIKPNFRSEIFKGIFAGTILGFLLIYIRERADKVFYNPDDVSKSLELPLLSNIPFVPEFKDLRKTSETIINILNKKNPEENDTKELRYQRFFYQEALRNLCTSIKFLNSDGNLRKTISITSSLPSEGKSLITILFAKTMAELGERVLLIDGDLRKPQIHKRLGLNNIRGLSNYLVDKEISLEMITQKIKDINNLDIVTSGTIPPDPTRLLNSKRFEKLCDSFNNDDTYDLVLFDSPPVLGISDTLILTSKTSGTCLVVSMRNIEKSLPYESVKKINSIANTNLLGLITNFNQEVKEGSKFLYNNSYSYGYSYAYGNRAYEAYSNYADVKNEKDLSEKDSNEKETGSSTNQSKILNLIDNIKNKLKEFTLWIDN